jgi:hypothetical protein
VHVGAVLTGSGPSASRSATTLALHPAGPSVHRLDRMPSQAITVIDILTITSDLHHSVTLYCVVSLYYCINFELFYMLKCLVIAT